MKFLKNIIQKRKEDWFNTDNLIIPETMGFERLQKNKINITGYKRTNIIKPLNGEIYQVYEKDKVNIHYSFVELLFEYQKKYNSNDTLLIIDERKNFVKIYISHTNGLSALLPPYCTEIKKEENEDEIKKKINDAIQMYSVGISRLVILSNKKFPFIEDYNKEIIYLSKREILSLFKKIEFFEPRESFIKRNVATYAIALLSIILIFMIADGFKEQYIKSAKEKLGANNKKLEKYETRNINYENDKYLPIWNLLKENKEVCYESK